MDYQKRIERLRNYLNEFSLDGFLVTDESNIRYMTGFEGEGVLLITEDSIFLISDQRFEIELSQQKLMDYVITTSYLKTVCEIINQHHLVAVGFESTIQYGEYDILDELSDSDIVSIENLVETLRAVKTNDEIDKIREANQIAEEGFEFIIHNLNNKTERNVANELDYFLKNNGMQKESFDTIVASGNNTLKPHHTTTNRFISNNQLLLLDYGYFFDDYTFDITRTFGIGKQRKEVLDVYKCVEEALWETVMIVKSGIAAKELNIKANQILAKYNLKQYFNHGIGHGIGLTVHELPNLNSNDLLESNMVITIEPGVYIPGIGGIRIENDILVTADGFENLTLIPTDFIEI